MTEPTAQQRWDERYRTSPALWSSEPNPQLVAQVGDLSPGSALDVGCGEGADAIWLARRGWTVLGVDVSAVALERAARHATETPGVDDRLTWLHADFDAGNDRLNTGGDADPGAPTRWTADRRFDLVNAQFIHRTDSERPALVKALTAAVAPGGYLLVVAHHPGDASTGVRRPPADMLCTAAELAQLLGAGWELVTVESRPREVTGPQGTPVTVHDEVVFARSA